MTSTPDPNQPGGWQSQPQPAQQPPQPGAAPEGLGAAPQGYAPPPQGYAPQQPGYPPQQPGYAPSPQGYAPQQPGYPPQQPGYPPQQPGYAPPPQGYAPQPQGYAPPPQPGAYPPPGYQQAPQAPVAYASEAQDAAENKAMGILAYIIFLIPLLAAPKQSRFARYHTNQGLVLFLLGLAYGLVWTVLTGILGAAVLTGGFALWSIVALVMSLLWLVYPVLAIVGIVNAAQGRMKPLPVIGGISILK